MYFTFNYMKQMNYVEEKFPRTKPTNYPIGLCSGLFFYFCLSFLEIPSFVVSEKIVLSIRNGYFALSLLVQIAFFSPFAIFLPYAPQ